jgi:histidyl-tRNA synthetase
LPQSIKMKPILPQGMRDFNTNVLKKREFILSTISSIFKLHGYGALETPAVENLETLTGKYGEEGNKLIFKILNNGLDDAKNIDKASVAFTNILSGKLDTNLTERALRYDLTIPFARFVAMNNNDIAYPFKRYQMQAVWRADKPQRGRYREFWQCDADVVGSTSLYYEAELLNIYFTAFEKLQIPQVIIKINNRKILAALATEIGRADAISDLTIAIDKLDKIGIEKVIVELQKKNISDAHLLIVQNYLNIKGTNEHQLIAIQNLLGHHVLGMEGITEIKEILQRLVTINASCKVQLDFTLARGLDYYTGLIVEVQTSAVKMGSIGGGGRYDNLTAMFDLPNVSGMGISFGVDRIYDVMEELQLFPNNILKNNEILFLNLGLESQIKSLEIMQTLRAQNIICDMYPEIVKMDKQLKYANKRNVGFVCIIGETELNNNTITCKNFSTGNQQIVEASTFVNHLKNNLL